MTDAQLIAELRAENIALKRVMTAMREKAGRTAILVTLDVSQDRMDWTVTAPWPALESEVARVIGEQVFERLTAALQVARIVFRGIKQTGTSREAGGTEEHD